VNILISATYFHPYRSGLSTYALRLARGLVGLGHKVVVLTSQYEPNLPEKEAYQGIVIIRVPVTARLSKGVLMTGLKRAAREWMTWADVVNLHLPQFESAMLAGIAKRMRKPVVITYHCDLEMKGGPLSRLAGWGTNFLAGKALRKARLIVQNSLDYAQHTSTLKPYLQKVVEVPTPINLKKADPGEIVAFREKYGLSKGLKIIGLAGRVAAEKGWEFLAQAMPVVWQSHPDAIVVHAGMWKGVVGEEKYQAKIEKMLKPFGERWHLLGFVDDAELNAFFGACDVFILASLNRTESFGIVQVEALAQGTPVIASDLPGIRMPVTRTGCGRLVKPRDIHALAEVIIQSLDKERQRCEPEEYLKQFAEAEVAARYSQLFEEAAGQ